MPRRFLALTAITTLAAGCASAPKPMSFAEAGFFEPVEPQEPPKPPVKVPAPRRVATEPPSGPPLDATLLHFAAEARQRRARMPAARGFPAEAISAWRDLAADLDRYLLRSLPQTPLLELTRARVTLEAELEYDRRHYGQPPTDLEPLVCAGIARLATRIASARALRKGFAARATPAALRWPIDNAGISSSFGLRLHPLDGVRRMHYGIDLAAETGRVVAAAAGGYVVHAGWSRGYGLMIEIRHAGDLTTRYSHLARLACAPGDAVDPGQMLGLVGATGKATGPHLHFEVWRGGKARNPLALLGAPALEGGAGN